MHRVPLLADHIGVAISHDEPASPLMVAISADGETWLTSATSREQAFAIAHASIRGILRMRALRKIAASARKDN